MSPKVRGLPIEIEFLPELKARRGKLLSGKTERGREVHAGCFLRQRRIVLDAALKSQPRELARILTHELFHFAWLRLGNPNRRRFEDLLQGEMRKRVRGELGWSAERMKAALKRADRARRTRAWREYVCESFCDSAAWLLAGSAGNEELTLPIAARRVRRAWFEKTRLTREISV
jgi:hypothetical protein